MRQDVRNVATLRQDVRNVATQVRTHRTHGTQNIRRLRQDATPADQTQDPFLLMTNKASQLPVDYIEALVNWMKFNRRNSQLRPKNLSTLPDTPAEIGRYRLSNICNMDQTPLPFEYLSGRTYNQQGEKTIWVQGSQQSGWEKRQATIQLTVFADAVPRVKPLIFFRGQGVGPTVVAERALYDPRVVVKFNPKAYANSTNIVEWLEEQVIPVLGGRPTLMALDMFGGHKTDEVLDTMRAQDITLSVIPGGCTSMVQPLDISINRPFKDILKVSITKVKKKSTERGTHRFKI